VQFQCSSASRKFLNLGRYRNNSTNANVSVLFSEPKIPQCTVSAQQDQSCTVGFSALQRAENSSMLISYQCTTFPRGFSALQRAENSSIGCALWHSLH